jgi:hypothetical protein
MLCSTQQQYAAAASQRAPHARRARGCGSTAPHAGSAHGRSLLAAARAAVAAL